MLHPLSKRPYDILTCGDMCVDLILSGPDVRPEFGQVEKLVGDYNLEMGGSSCIFACQAGRLGMKVGILGKVGKDSFGDLILSRLRECGVDTRFVQVDTALKTGLGLALCQGNDRAILTYLGTINSLAPTDIQDDLLSQTRHLHHGSFFLQTGLRSAIPAIFARARSLGLTVSLDTNWDPQDHWKADWQDLLCQVDLFMPNQQEALKISTAGTLDEAVCRLHALGARWVVVKRGSEGALVSDGEQVHYQTVQPAPAGGDSIGSGDSFDAGFLAGWLRGLPVTECLRIACECGRRVASAVGGLNGQPDWEDVKG